MLAPAPHVVRSAPSVRLRRPRCRGSGPADVFAAGFVPSFVRFDGVAWTPETTTATQDFYAIWGSGPGDIWAIAEHGETARRTP